MGLKNIANSIGVAAKDYANEMTKPLGKLNNLIGDKPSQASSFQANDYSISNLSYPADLMAEDGRYGGNYVVFYINVLEESKLAKGQSTMGPAEFVENIPNRIVSDLVGMKANKSQLFTGQLGLVAGGAVLGKALGVGGGATGAAAGLAAIGTGVLASVATTASRQTKRLKTAIALHVPNQLSIRYGMQWDEDETFALQAATAAGSELAQAAKSGSAKGLTDTGKAVIANLALSKGPNAGGMSAATGLAANPKKEQVFKGVDFRKFSFDYQFFPRNEKEAENVLNIIKHFKYHMHPEFKDNTNFLYLYPSEFDIMYYQGGKENMNLHRHTSCVLEEININYTPNGAFTTFPNGMPTQINVTMQFKELALLTKDRVEDGL